MNSVVRAISWGWSDKLHRQENQYLPRPSVLSVVTGLSGQRQPLGSSLSWFGLAVSSVTREPCWQNCAVAR